MDLVMITSHQREKSMPNRIFSSVLLIIATLQLTGCAGAILGAGVAAIGASSSEKGFATTINDTSISLKIRDKFVQTDIDLVEGRNFGLIIANINRNILLNDMKAYMSCLGKEGTILFSGFYKEDIPFIDAEVSKYGLKLEKTFERNNWVSLKYTK